MIGGGGARAKAKEKKAGQHGPTKHTKKETFEILRQRGARNRNAGVRAPSCPVVTGKILAIQTHDPEHLREIIHEEEANVAKVTHVSFYGLSVEAPRACAHVRTISQRPSCMRGVVERPGVGPVWRLCGGYSPPMHRGTRASTWHALKSRPRA